MLAKSSPRRVEPRHTSGRREVLSPAPVRNETPPVESQVLLQGQRTVEIRHNGEIYRLQETRLGKLILTK